MTTLIGPAGQRIETSDDDRNTTSTKTASWTRETWFVILCASIFLEGLGRKVFSEVPSQAFYFAKDGVLLLGLFSIGIQKIVRRSSLRLLGLGLAPLLLAVGWTLMELANPSVRSFLLGLIGVRAYWYWWIAPLIVATAALRPVVHTRFVLIIGIFSAFVAGFALLQFASPPDAKINQYATYRGETMVETAIVAETGRARVASTFSFISGFVDFCVLAPPLLIVYGLKDKKRWRRVFLIISALAVLIVLPMSGSRAPVVFSAISLVIVAWRLGFIRTKMGRRLVIFVPFAIATVLILSPTAYEGLKSRFAYSDTRARLRDGLDFLPPITLSSYDWTIFGEGTGTQHNARVAFGYNSPFDVESETGRELFEQGGAGFLLVWCARAGLAIALLKISRLCDRARDAGGGALAIVYALFVMIGPMVFDHVWQSTIFVMIGFVLARSIQVSGGAADNSRARAGSV